MGKSRARLDGRSFTELMTRLESVYWIGGAPCSGKTPISCALAELGDATVYHLDEHHDEHIRKTSPETHPAWHFLNPDGRLTRPPDELADFYIRECHERFGLILDDLRQMKHRRVIADGASFLPEVLMAAGVAPDHVAFINVSAETRSARWRHQRTDDWKGFLGRYVDPDAAWETWMKRDELLAEHMATEATRLGMLVVDAEGMSHEDVISAVARHFGWE